MSIKTKDITVSGCIHTVDYTSEPCFYRVSGQSDETIEGVEITVISVDGSPVSDLDIDTMEDICTELERYESPESVRNRKYEEDGLRQLDNMRDK